MTINLLILLIITLVIALFLIIKQLMAQKQVISQQAINVANAKQQMAEKQLKHVEELDIAVAKAKKKSLDFQRDVVKGQIGEQFTPFIADFPYNPADCRFMGEPIDYVIFHNLHACSEGSVPIEDVKVIFAEIKTGKAKLNPRQKILRQVIENKQFSFEELRIKTDDGQNPAVHNI